MQRIYVHVVGVVQGVWFRRSTQEQASRLGLVGWVRNRSDGSVELEAQGEAAKVAALVQWCHDGPPAARVRSVTPQTIEPVSGENSFDIRYD